MKYNKLLLALLPLFLFYFHTQPVSLTAKENQVNLTILGTSDVHGQLFNFSYESDKEDNRGSFIQVSSMVNKIRAENPNTILIDSGDNIQGTPLTDDLYNTVLVNEPHPIIKAMNLMKYDAMAVGNHEFNFGLDLIQKMIKEARFPILGCNVTNRSDGSHYLKPYTIVERSGIRIGIIGAVIPSVPMWDGPKVTSLEFHALAPSVKEQYDYLINYNIADIVIVTAHSGLEGNHFDEGTAAHTIYKEVPGIAVLLTGHDHVSITKVEGNIPVAGPRNAGRDLCRIDLVLEKQNDKWTVTDSKVQNLVVADQEIDTELAAKMSYAHERTLKFISKPVATATSNFLPIFEFDHEHLPASLVMDTALVNFINKVQMHYVPEADISATAILFPDANLRKGPIAYKHIFDIYRYPNSLCGVEISGKELRNYIESSARFYNTWKPGDANISFNPDIRAYNYDMFMGVEYELDISKEPGSRLVKLTKNGKPIQDNDSFKIALNNYRYSVLKNIGSISNEAYYVSDPLSLRSMMFDYVKELGTVSPVTDNNWRLVGYDKDHWARRDAVNLINNKIIELESAARVFNTAPINLEDNVTRGQFVKALVKTLDLKLADNKTVDIKVYSDVDDNLKPYVMALHSQGVDLSINGAFHAGRFIQRDDALAYLFGALKHDPERYPALKVSDYTSARPSERLKLLIEISDKYNLLEKRKSGRFSPDSALKRGEKARLLNALLTGEFKDGK